VAGTAELGSSSSTTMLNNISIKTILTLRYDASLKETLIPKLSWEHFQQKDPSHDPVSQVERIIIENMKQKISESGQGKVAFSLSGGIDSTLIFSLLRKNMPDIDVQAISVRFSNSQDETSQAAKIASQFDSNHHIVHVDNYLQELPAAISIVKLPFWDLHWYHVVKKAKDFSSILISGDGGDELFGGYTFRYSKFLSLVRDDFSVSSKIRAYLDCHERDWVPDQDRLFGTACKFSWDEIHDILRNYFDNSLDPITQVFLADFNGKLLYNWLPLNTAFHDFFGVKAVTPLISPDLINYSTHLPHLLKYDATKNEGKLVLRKLLLKYLGGKSVPNMISSAKQGFSVDTIKLWNNYGHRICKYYLSNARIVKEERWIDEAWIKDHIDKVEGYSNPRYVNKFLGLLALEVWYRLFVSKELSRTDKLD